CRRGELLYWRRFIAVTLESHIRRLTRSSTSTAAPARLASAVVLCRKVRKVTAYRLAVWIPFVYRDSSLWLHISHSRLSIALLLLRSRSWSWSWSISISTIIHLSLSLLLLLLFRIGPIT